MKGFPGGAPMMETGPVRIDLSRERPFTLGTLAVVPAFRQISRGPISQTVEPRVMQVLVALARADGAIVGRDALIECCWEGRVVGDNAINRVISILRQLSVRPGDNSFAIETVTKVGYRLTTRDTPDRAVLPDGETARSAGNPTSRRAILALASAGLCGAAWLGWRALPSSNRRGAMLLYERGRALQGQGWDDADQSVAYFIRAVRVDPGFAQAWGALALARARLAPPGDAAAPEELQRVRADAHRALRLDPHNKEATLALILVEPYWRNWGTVEREARTALLTMPGEVVLRAKLGSILSHVGRFREGAAALAQAVAQEPLVPAYQVFLWRALWGAGRLSAARALVDRAYARWPDNLSIWLARCTFLVFAGDAAGVAAMGARGSAGRSDANPLPIDLALLAARAFETGDAALRAKAIAAVATAAAADIVPSFLAIPCFSALGAVDRAFAASYDLYFGKRDPLSGERELAARHDPRMTFLLFQPPTAPMRADPRFAKLTRAIGLDDYWRDSGRPPDFRANQTQPGAPPP